MILPLYKESNRPSSVLETISMFLIQREWVLSGRGREESPAAPFEQSEIEKSSVRQSEQTLTALCHRLPGYAAAYAHRPKVKTETKVQSLMEVINVIQFTEDAPSHKSLRVSNPPEPSKDLLKPIITWDYFMEELASQCWDALKKNRIILFRS